MEGMSTRPSHRAGRAINGQAGHGLNGGEKRDGSFEMNLRPSRRYASPHTTSKH